MWSSAKSPRVPRLSRVLRYDFGLSSLRWNQCPVSRGISVQIRLESVSSLVWNSQLVGSGAFSLLKLPHRCANCQARRTAHTLNFHTAQYSGRQVLRYNLGSGFVLVAKNQRQVIREQFAAFGY